jgi:hypothetical protein
MAAEEQLRELGEKLQAAAPAPVDALAKLLEVRPAAGQENLPSFEACFFSRVGRALPAAAPRTGRVSRGSVAEARQFGWFRV